MAKPEDIKKKAKETAEIVEDALRSISSKVGEIFDEALTTTDKFSKSLQNDVTKGLNSLAKTSSLIETNLSKLNKGNLTRLSIEKQIEERQIKFNSLQTQLNIAVKASLIDREEANNLLEEAISYNKELNEELESQAKQADEINRKLGNTGKIFKGFTKIPILGQLIDSEKVLAKVQAESAKEGSTKTSVFKSGLKETGKTIKDSLLDPTILVGGAFTILVKIAKFFFDALLGASIQTAKFRRDFGLTNKEAEQLRQRTYDISRNAKQYADTQSRILITQPQIVKSLEEINRALGTQIDFTKDLGDFGKQLLVQDAILRDNLQLDEETRAAINKEAIRTGKTTEQITKSSLGNVAAVGLQRKILLDNNKILTAASKITGELRSSFKGNTEEIAKGIAKLELMGLTLEQSKKIAGGLLNFEQSIAAEIEAELLTGKDLNLEKARLLAINRKYVELGQEIVNQGLTTNELNNMNSVQLDAQTAAYSLTSDELTDIVQKTEEYNALTARAAQEGKKVLIGEKTSLKDIYDQLQKQGAGEKEIVRILGDKIYAEKQAEDAQMKFNKALDQAKASFERLVSSGTLDKLVDALTSLVDSLSGGVTGALTGTNRERAEAKRGVRQYEEAKTNLSGDLKSELEKAVAENTSFWNMLGQTTINTIAHPITSLFETSIEKQTKAREQLTAEAYTDFQKSHPDVQINAKDYVIKTLPQDTVVAAGGTNLGRTDEIVSLLSQILHKEGYVAINSTKFGTGYSLGNFKAQ